MDGYYPKPNWENLLSDLVSVACDFNEIRPTCWNRL